VEKRKRLARFAHGEFFLGTLALIERVDVAAERPDPARGDHRLDGFLTPREDGFDRGVTAVAHPALQIALLRMMSDESAEADALHLAADRDVPDDAGLIIHT
jgi:hypothetical protein